MRAPSAHGLLLFITTHCSPQHANFLRTGQWPLTLHSLPPATERVFFVTGNGMTGCARRCRIPPVFRPYRVHCDNTTGYQRGAIAGMRSAASRRIFKNAVWVLRVNPDVLVRNSRALVELCRPGVDAVVATCKSRTRTKFHTDFALFRPEALDYDAPESENAETDFANMLHGSRYTVAWANPTDVCRMGAQGLVVHRHGPSAAELAQWFDIYL